MAQRQKQSVSLPAELADAIEHAAAVEGTTVSGWLADTAAHRLRLDAGRRGIAAWERDNGPLTRDELADGLARARTLLGRPSTQRCAKKSAQVGVTYNTGALIAAEGSDRRMCALHAGFLAEEVSTTVPAPVLAEGWRGGSRQANMARLLAMCAVEHMTEDQAKAVGVLAGRAAHDDVVDVTVVEGAVRRHDGVVTSNKEHIERVAQATRGKLRIESV